MKSIALSLSFVLSLVLAAFATAVAPQAAGAAPRSVLEQADYLFDCTPTSDPVFCGPDGALPDPAVWTADRVPVQNPNSWCAADAVAVAQCAWEGSGLTLVDPGNATQLLYGHQLQQLSGDPASPAHYNTAKFRVVSSAGYVSDGSGFWSAETTAWRMIFDDGQHRLELKFGRRPGMTARQVWIGNTSVPAFEFPWDNGLPNTFEIERHSNGDFTVTIRNWDPSVPAQTRFIPGGMLSWTHGTPIVAWGAAAEGGIVASWYEAHLEVSRPAGKVSGKGTIDSPAGAVADMPGAIGPAKFSLSTKFAKGMPSGQVAFEFKAANIAFKSTSIDALRVMEAGARIEGRGTVNGAGDYRFILRVVDGQLAGSGGTDAFHIRIWDPKTYTGYNATYDNEPGNDPWWHDATWPLSGGSISLR